MYYNLISNLLCGAIGALLGSLISILYSRKASKDSLTNQILNTFNSKDFLFAIRVVAFIRKDWNNGKRDIINCFVPNMIAEKENLLENNLTKHQNLIYYLRFLSQLEFYYNKNLINKDIITGLLLIPHYHWNMIFLTEFRDEYLLKKKEYAPNSKLPEWINTINNLNKILQ